MNEENSSIRQDNEPQEDLLGRGEFAKKLANYLVRSEHGVYALDAEWGSGKTFFTGKIFLNELSKVHCKIYKINNYLNILPQDIIKGNNNESNIVYFNAFKHDFSSEPFTAIAYELIKKFDSTPKNIKVQLKKELDNLKRNAGKLIKYTSKSLLREGSGALSQLVTGGLLNFNLFKVAENALNEYDQDKIKTEEEQLQDWYNNSNQLHSVVENIKKSLNILIKHTTEQKIYFIIDDLDRCRPDFAIELLEKIKHIFEVEGIVYLLTTDLGNLGKSLKNVYGDIDDKEYFRKFINMTFKFPASDDNKKIDSNKFLEKDYYARENSLCSQGFHNYDLSKHNLTPRQLMQVANCLDMLYKLGFDEEIIGGLAKEERLRKIDNDMILDLVIMYCNEYFFDNHKGKDSKEKSIIHNYFEKTKNLLKTISSEGDKCYNINHWKSIDCDLSRVIVNSDSFIKYLAQNENIPSPINKPNEKNVNTMFFNLRSLFNTNNEQYTNNGGNYLIHYLFHKSTTTDKKNILIQFSQLVGSDLITDLEQKDYFIFFFLKYFYYAEQINYYLSFADGKQLFDE